MNIIIIGGVAGGATCATRIRRLDESAKITIVEKGEYVSFANCGLPYYIGDEIKDRENLLLSSPKHFKDFFNIDVKIRCEAVKIDRANKLVHIIDRNTGETSELPYDQLLIATGASPINLTIENYDNLGAFTLRTIADADNIKKYIELKKPETALIIGGGAIGIEMAENLVSHKIDVTIVEYAGQLMPSYDPEMAKQIQNHIEDMGVSIHLNSKVEKIIKDKNIFTVIASDLNLQADMLIVSIGVRPDSSLAKDAGLEISPKGYIVVDDRMKTSDPMIYAVGDVVQTKEFITGNNVSIPLAGPANRQGHIVAGIMCGIDGRYDGVQGSSILKAFKITAAKSGLSEKEAKAANINYQAAIINPFSHASYYPGASRMWIKGIFDVPTRQIIGVQIVGDDGVDKRCDVLATSIRARLTAEDLASLELSYAPPYSSAKDPVNILGYHMSNILSGLVKCVTWEFVDNLSKNEPVTLLDVRPSTFGQPLEGFIHIPLKNLRSKLHELDKRKKIYVICITGQTSYMACRILSANGFDAHNISGGAKFYYTMSQKRGI